MASEFDAGPIVQMILARRPLRRDLSGLMSGSLLKGVQAYEGFSL